MKTNIKETLKIYWQHSYRYKWLALLVIISCLSNSLLVAIVPLYYKKFFDLFTSELVPSEMARNLFILLLTIGLLNALGKLINYCFRALMIRFQCKCLFDLADTCFTNIHRHSFAYFNNNFSGALVKKSSYFTRSFELITDNIVNHLLPASAVIIAVVSILLFKNKWLGIISLIWLVVYLVINWLVIKGIFRSDLERNEAESALTADLSDTIGNHNNVRLFNGWRRESKTFNNLNKKIMFLRIKAWMLHANSEFMVAMMAVALELGLMYYGFKLWQQGMFTVGDFVMLQAYAVLVINRITWLGSTIRKTYQALSDASEMTEILKTPLEIVDAPNAKKLSVSSGAITFQAVDFYFNETRPVLNKLSLQVSAGERLALIGPSGVGKTTIINLLLRNFDLAGGKILIDAQDISKVTLHSLRASISLVPQDPILFHRSLLENIAYGKEGATKAEIIKAAKQANCHQFISNLPDGYDTLVGERGVKLSGGERQRVAIARAILRGAPILILDEATSSLDSESEALIQEALDKLMKNKTVIVIAHRLSTIRKMDRIVYLNEKGIAESGAHEDLVLKPAGLYRKLWERQVSGFLTN